MKIVKKKSTENCHFYSREKPLYVALAFFRNDNYTYLSLEIGICSPLLLPDLWSTPPV